MNEKDTCKDQFEAVVVLLGCMLKTAAQENPNFLSELRRNIERTHDIYRDQSCLTDSLKSALTIIDDTLSTIGKT